MRRVLLLIASPWFWRGLSVAVAAFLIYGTYQHPSPRGAWVLVDSAALIGLLWLLGNLSAAPKKTHKDTRTVLRNALDAMERSQNGIRWYRDLYPQHGSVADDEFDAELHLAIEDAELHLKELG